MQGRIDGCFDCWHQILTVFPTFGWEITGVAHDFVPQCRGPSSSNCIVLCARRSSSACLDYNKQLFEWPLPLCNLQSSSPILLQPRVSTKHFSAQRTAAHWILNLFWDSPLWKPRDGCAATQLISSLWNAQVVCEIHWPIWHQQPCHIPCFTRSDAGFEPRPAVIVAATSLNALGCCCETGWLNMCAEM